MRLDNKLKIAAFDTAMKSLLKNKNKYPDRTARNILESGAAVFHRSMNEDEKRMPFFILRKNFRNGMKIFLPLSGIYSAPTKNARPCGLL